MPDANSSTRTRLPLLTLGAVVGLLMAAAGLVERWSLPSGDLPGDAIARVGDQLISRQRYQQLISDLATDKRMPLSDEDRQFTLDRLVDEELLIMRGIELGLAETAPNIRKAIAAAMIAQIAAEAEATPPDEAALRHLYETDAEYFTATGRYRLRWLLLPGTGQEAQRKAATAYAQLQSNTPMQAVMRSTGLQSEPLLPDQMLPLSKLSDYLGPVLARQIPQLEPGEYSRPVAADGSFHILQLVTRKAGFLPAFEQVQPMVEAEYLRRAGDEALRNYLAWLRARTQIIVAAEKMQ